MLRWSWRVGYYSYSALGTDRYPPFSLQAGGYPADLDVRYPEQLSRGLVLVKWWLLAIPHYVIIGIFGGGWWLGWWQPADARWVGQPPGTDRSAGRCSPPWRCCSPAATRPRSTRFVMGLNRWVYRVIAYATLMTDEYPPFRLDQGGAEAVAPSVDPPVDPSQAP